MAGSTRCRALFLLIASVCFHFAVLVNCQSMCGFETGICGWQQSKQDKFDWTRQSGSTSSTNTGPTTDHTSIAGTLNTTGYYMYIETSSPRSHGDNARLVSPLIKNNGGKGSCFTFWYHMYGAHVDTLNIYVRYGQTDNLIWNRAGDNGNLWENAQVDLLSKRDYRIVIEGIRGKDYQGDISVDDVNITEGYCDFESGLCGYTNLKTDAFDWIVGSGETLSPLTGPKFDHTSGFKNGSYVFLESSSPRKQNETAVFQSEKFKAVSGGIRCLSFWYHMYGSDIGSLEVIYKVFSGSTPNKVIWRLLGQQHNSGLDPWKNARVPIDMSSDHLIMFRGTIGTSYNGDIAIDDIQFTSLSCIVVPSNALTLPTTSGEYKCNFENGICKNWYQDNTDQLDWTLGKGNTSSSGTGPATDHTKKDAFGQYLYLEVSGQTANKAARLISTQISATTRSGGKCLKFYYHMYGPDVNTLNVYVFVGTIYSVQPIWTRKGSQGNKWILGQVTLHAGQPFKAAFEATVGNSYQGDITIDDISLSDGKCIQPSSTCTFDNDLCGYTNDTGSDIKLNWKKQSLHTASSGTGPNTDHTLKSASGFYIYTEASSTSHDDIARILSPIESATSGSCLVFWYHMYGSGMGTLAVHLKKGNALSTRSIWSETGNKGNKWRRANVTVKSTTNYQLAFQGRMSGSFKSDMAVDDIKLTKGPCPPPGHCDFESGLCGYTNLKTDAFDWIVGSGETPSTLTGPKFDHTTGFKNGSYIFLESSSPRKQNETAVFQSEKFKAVSGGIRCLSFWYHMYGSDIGGLEVIYKVFSGSTPNKVIWRLLGQQHNSGLDPWKNARVPIDMSSDHLIMFRGTIGTSYNGDIAIDDIQFTSLSCIVVPSNALTLPTTSDTFRNCRNKIKARSCNASLRFRSFDGTCNNLANPTWGAANTKLLRLIAAEYADNNGTPRGFGIRPNIPSSNNIALELFTMEQENGRSNFSALFMTFGQFLDHDISLAPHPSSRDCRENCSSASSFNYPCFPIKFNQTGDSCTPFSRAIPVCRGSGGTSRDQINKPTAFVDASQIYGTTVRITNKLRTNDDTGGLKLEKKLLPLDPSINPCNVRGGCSLVGDGRGDENIALHTMHTLWTREHNRIAQGLKRYHPGWTRDRLFYTARRINTAQFQHIVYTEYLPSVVELDPYSGYKSDINPSISNGFSTAAFRYGHSLIPNSFAQLDSGFNRKHNPIPLRLAFGTRQTIDARGIEPTMFGLIGNLSNDVDTGFAFGISRRLFVPPGEIAHRDLTAFNIQRGRDHGIPTYGKWRQFCNLPKINSLDDLDSIMSPSAEAAFKKLGQPVDDLDLFAAGISEQHTRGKAVGPTFGCIIKNQFERLRDGDRFYYEAPGVLQPNELSAIKKVTMARILCDNLKGIVSVQRGAFRNSKLRIECGSVPNLNLAVFV